MPDAILYTGDCRDILSTLADGSIDAIISDPPYPYIKRDYGYWTFDEWMDLMKPVVYEATRILKPHGSAMFVLQSNSKHIGELRPWLWEFMAWVSKAWNVVQDVWWWNISALPGTCGATRKYGLMRPSVKLCAWIGDPDCYRNQDAVLWEPADIKSAKRQMDRAMQLGDPIEHRPSGRAVRRGRFNSVALGRGGRPIRKFTTDMAQSGWGGVTPFNLIPLSGARGSGIRGHSAGTPLALCDWWVRYVTKPGWTILDPFVGAGSVGVAAIKRGRDFIGIDVIPEYVDISYERIRAI